MPEGIVLANAFGFRARTDFRQGLRDTIRWYEENYTQLSMPPESREVVHQ
jgi:dTDP-D-glucose 4,6-dehydratase